MITLHREQNRWNVYLNELRIDTPEDVSLDQVRAVIRLWKTANSRYPNLSPPAAGLIDDGLFHLVWNRGEHYCEVDLYANGDIDWCYKNRTTSLLDGEDRANVISEKLLEAIAHFQQSV